MSTTPVWAIPYVPENTNDPAAGLNLALLQIDESISQTVVDHVAEPDPHPQYATPAEAAAAAPVQTVQGRTGAVTVTKSDLALDNVDNTSDANKPLSDAATTALALKLNTALKGAANGLAELDNDGKVPLSQTSDAVLGQLSYQGLWNANTNTPTLPATPAQKGDYYIASVAGTQFGLEFDVGDWLVSDGAAWGKVDNTDAVASVNGKKGVVTITKADVGLGNADNTSDLNKPVSTAQQAALNLKVNTDDARLSDAREWTATEVSQVEAEAGTATTARKWTALRARQAVVAWWNSISSAWGRGFVASADAAAGRSALGLGTFATANYAAAPFINLMPDSGRFAGRMNPLLRPASGAFAASPFFTAYNGAITSNAGKFIHDNTTNGGIQGELTEPVVALLSALGRVTEAEKRYGVEFYVATITAGASATIPNVGADGVTRFLATINDNKAIFGANNTTTSVFWIRVTAGSVHLLREFYLDGVLSPAGTSIPSGYHHIRCVRGVVVGYETAFPHIYASSDAVINIALPAFFPGLVDVGLHKAPLPTINELSA